MRDLTLFIRNRIDMTLPCAWGFLILAVAAASSAVSSDDSIVTTIDLSHETSPNLQGKIFASLNKCKGEIMDLLGYYSVICRIDMFTEPIHVQGPAKMHRQKAGMLKQPCKLFFTFIWVLHGCGCVAIINIFSFDKKKAVYF
jgi:hypothetical protein